MKPAPSDPFEINTRLWDGFSPGKVAWDIGANCGQTIPRLLQSYDWVVAFEPAKESFDYLVENVDALVSTAAPKSRTLRLLEIAVSDKDGYTDLIALPDKIDTGQLVTAGTHGMEWNPEGYGAQERTVRARTVDSLTIELQEPPNFMKIDVEGHELAVLKGAKDVLIRESPEMLIEIHSQILGEQCKELLLSLNYSLDCVRHPHYAPGSPMWFTHFWYRCFPS